MPGSRKKIIRYCFLNLNQISSMQFSQILLIEFIVILIAMIFFLAFQVLNLAKNSIQNEMYRFEIKEISYAQVVSTISVWIGIHLALFFILNKKPIEYQLTVIGFFLPLISLALPRRYPFFDKKIGYRIAADPLISPGILGSYLENQKRLIGKLRSNSDGKFDEIKTYIQKFENYSDYFQPIELIRMAIDTSREFDGLLAELEKNIRKTGALHQAQALDLILSARLPIYQFKEIFSDIQMKIVRRSGNEKEQIYLFKIYCECIKKVVIDYVYPEKDKKDIVRKFFLIFNELSSERLSFQDNTADSNLIESVCNHFNSIFLAVKEFIPFSGKGHFFQDGIDGMKKIEMRAFSGSTKKYYSDIMNNMIDEIKKRQEKE